MTENHFEQLITALQINSSSNDDLYEITCILEKQNSDLLFVIYFSIIFFNIDT